MNVEKQICKTRKKIIKDLKKGKKQTKVITLVRKDFKKKLSTNVGFGFQDLKKAPKKLISTLNNEGYDLQFLPKDLGEMELRVTIKH